MVTYANLKKFFDAADDIDRMEGQLAYSRYNQVMQWFADEYGYPLETTTAAFVALSPNNDYYGNLRSLASVLDGFRRGDNVDDVTVSTYKACRNRAYKYLSYEADFLSTVKGPKITAFYKNILDPTDKKPVTVDGHMIAAWHGAQMTMKEAARANTMRTYRAIETAIRRIAGHQGLVSNQVQATIWFARKRVLNIKYDGQLKLFGSPDDKWGTLVTPDEALPY